MSIAVDMVSIVVSHKESTERDTCTFPVCVTASPVLKENINNSTRNYNL